MNGPPQGGFFVESSPAPLNLALWGTCSVLLDPIDLFKRIELAFIAAWT